MPNLELTGGRQCSRSTVAALLVLASVLTDTTPVAADDRLLAYGKHLAQECTSCHRLDGTATGIPSIVGMDPAVFKVTLQSFAKGERPNPVMISVARSLDAEQMDALAAYFASLAKR